MADVVFVLEHQLAGQGSQTVERPWYLFFFHFLEKFQVPGTVKMAQLQLSVSNKMRMAFIIGH